MMGIFDAVMKLSKYELALVNLFRLWIHTITVANLVDPSVTYVASWAKMELERLHSTLTWPIQEQPTIPALRLWQYCLFKSLNLGFSLRLRLGVPLKLEQDIKLWTGQSHIRPTSIADKKATYLPSVRLAPSNSASLTKTAILLPSHKMKSQ